MFAKKSTAAKVGYNPQISPSAQQSTQNQQSAFLAPVAAGAAAGVGIPLYLRKRMALNPQLAEKINKEIEEAKEEDTPVNQTFSFNGDQEFVPRDQLLRKSMFHEFPHIVVAGFQSPSTIHTLLKHIVQDRGYVIHAERCSITPTVLIGGNLYNDQGLKIDHGDSENIITGGVWGERMVAKPQKGSGVASAAQKGMIPKVSVEFWVSYVGILHASVLGGGLELKVMIAAHIRDIGAELQIRSDFEAVKQAIPDVLQISLKTTDWKISSIRPLKGMDQGFMPYVAPPAVKLALPTGLADKYREILETRFPLKYIK